MFATLSRRMVFAGAALMAGLLLLGAAPLWALTALQHQSALLEEQFEEMRIVADVERYIAAAHGLLEAQPSEPVMAVIELRSAIDRLETLIRHEHGPELGGEEHGEMDRVSAERAAHALGQILSQVENGRWLELSLTDGERTRPYFDEALSAMADLSERAQVAVDHTRRVVGRRFDQTLRLMVVLALVIATAGVAISVQQYRAVMRPLARLRSGVRRIAGGNFNQRLSPERDREFTDLADDFNHMAGELEGLYANLERQVAVKSRELVRSERLASVGFLAAGVAHEINNPLGIICGYAELTLRSLQRGADPATIDEALTAIRIIRDESLRCKDITEKLLSMSRMDDRQRAPVSVAAVARDVANMFAGLDKYRDRRLTVEVAGADADDDQVVANDRELKQVLLNLMVNALEATEPHVGVVRIDIRRDGGWVIVAVSDNGRGMTPRTVEHVFEPFFSERSNGRRGVGLGLSVTHAIVESHGGRITASSPGPSLGSCFTVFLPAMAHGEAACPGPPRKVMS